MNHQGRKNPNAKKNKLKEMLPEGVDVSKVAEVEEMLASATDTEVALTVAMILNGGNITKAADTIGINGSYARGLVSRKPVIRQAAQMYRDTMLTSLAEWTQLVPQAKGTLMALLHDSDGKVRYLAAKEILDRAEGKAVAKVDLTVKDERPALSELEVQLAFSMMRELGWDYARCVQYIKDNPQETDEWISRERARIGSGTTTPSQEGGMEGEDYEIVQEATEPPPRPSGKLKIGGREVQAPRDTPDVPDALLRPGGR